MFAAIEVRHVGVCRNKSLKDRVVVCGGSPNIVVGGRLRAERKGGD